MPTVDCYYLSDDTDYNVFACRLLEKIYHNKHRVVVLTHDMTAALALDEKLWTFLETSFIPHIVQHHHTTQLYDTPIILTTTLTQIPPLYHDVLLNLSNTTTDQEHNELFNRILAIFTPTAIMTRTDEKITAYYQQLGYAVSNHQIKKLNSKEYKS